MLHHDATFRLPGMELLGFFDEPYRIRVDQPKPPPRAMARATTAHPPLPASPPSPDRHRGRSLVESLWETTTLDDSLLDWRPGVVARRKLGGRQLSTATMAATLVTAALLSALLWFAVQRPGQQAEAANAAIRADAILALEAIGDLRDLTMAITSGEAGDLSSSTAVVLAAESSARALFSSTGALDDALEPGSRREAGAAVSGDMLAATAAVNRLLAYRAAAERALVPPPWPSDPAALDLTTAIGAVAEWRAAVEDAIDALPDQVLGAHRQSMAEWEAGMQAWQERYLDSLREGDAGAAEEALATMEDEVTSLRADLGRRLEGEATRIAGELDEAESTLAALVAG